MAAPPQAVVLLGTVGTRVKIAATTSFGGSEIINSYGEERVWEAESGLRRNCELQFAGLEIFEISKGPFPPNKPPYYCIPVSLPASSCRGGSDYRAGW